MSFAAGLRQALDLRQSDLISELRHGDSLEDILSKHLLAVERMSDREILTSVLLLSPDGKHLSHGAAPSLPKSYCEAIDGTEIGPAVGSCGTAAYLGRPVYVTDIARDPLWAAFSELALSHGLRSCWSTPIRHLGGDVLGTFAIYHRSLSGPTRAELNAIEMITDKVAEVITSARNPAGHVHVSDALPRQVGALQALAAAIAQQAHTLDDEGRQAVDAVVNDVRTLAEVVQRRHAGLVRLEVELHNVAHFRRDLVDRRRDAQITTNKLGNRVRVLIWRVAGDSVDGHREVLARCIWNVDGRRRQLKLHFPLEVAGRLL